MEMQRQPKKVASHTTQSILLTCTPGGVRRRQVTQQKRLPRHHAQLPTSRKHESFARKQAGVEPGIHLEKEEHAGEVQEANHARDDDGCQRIERHVAEHRREAQQDHPDEGRVHQAGQPCTTTARISAKWSMRLLYGRVTWPPAFKGCSVLLREALQQARRTEADHGSSKRS